MSDKEQALLCKVVQDTFKKQDRHSLELAVIVSEFRKRHKPASVSEEQVEKLSRAACKVLCCIQACTWVHIVHPANVDRI